MNVLKMEVSKKVKSEKTGEGEYQLVGTVEVPVFELKEFNLAAEAASYDKDTGLPVYSDPKVQFVFDAILAATKADSRNKLQTGTATLKAGAKIADTVEELIAKADTGAALALNREFLTSFSTYLAEKSGKAAAVQALYNGMAKNRQSIPLNNAARKAGLLAQLTAYFEQATAADVAKFEGILSTISELCSEDASLDDADL